LLLPGAVAAGHAYIVCKGLPPRYSPRRFTAGRRADRNKELRMFITPAFAQATGGSPLGPDMLIQFLPFVFIFVIMYFLIIRPQRNKAKLHQEMVANIRRGDTVVTTGGFIAKVAKVAKKAKRAVKSAKA